MCRANDIKQKHLLGGNPTKKSELLPFSLIFFFVFYFIFVILLYSFSFISILRTMLCLKCGGIKRILAFFVFFFIKKSLSFIF